MQDLVSSENLAIQYPVSEKPFSGAFKTNSSYSSGLAAKRHCLFNKAKIRFKGACFISVCLFIAPGEGLK